MYRDAHQSQGPDECDAEDDRFSDPNLAVLTRQIRALALALALLCSDPRDQQDAQPDPAVGVHAPVPVVDPHDRICPLISPRIRLPGLSLKIYALLPAHQQ